mgnify:CR=1 FL=1
MQPSNIRFLEGHEGSEHRRLEVRGLTATIVDFTRAGPSLAQHKYRARVVATLDLEDVKWMLSRMIERKEPKHGD